MHNDCFGMKNILLKPFTKHQSAMKKILIYLFILLFAMPLFAQRDKSLILKNTNVVKLDSLSKVWRAKAEREKATAIIKAKEMGWPIRKEMSDGRVIELMKLDKRGEPIYYTTNNVDAATTTRTDRLHSGGGAGLDLEGDGMTIGEWDEGKVRDTHEQFSGNRVDQVDGSSTLSDHATHVAGTLIGDGTGTGFFSGNAKGMAPQAELDAYDWTNDESEMATAASNGLLVSNHSYGGFGGYDFEGNGQWTWYGGGLNFKGSGEDPDFGYYSSESENWDEIAYDAPYYLIVKAAGNDRKDNPETNDQIRNGQNGTYVNYNPSSHPDGDGEVDNGYDNLMPKANAKNVLTVAAVGDVPNYTGAGDVVMTSFSSWGPTDDGRIKPDISANGQTVYSAGMDSNTDYSNKSGTSMASPNVAGSAILLQEHYENIHGSGQFMKSATLKGLIIHTADEAGPDPGPDYKFGWGLMNTEAAAALITKDEVIPDVITENGYVPFVGFTKNIYSDGTEPLKVTICWTDWPGSPGANPFDIPDIPFQSLEWDHDLRLEKSGTTYFPYVLDPSDPAAAATKTNNDRDNVEQIYIANPSPGTYTVNVTQSNSSPFTPIRYFSMIITGGCANTYDLTVNNSGSSIDPDDSPYTAFNNVVTDGTKVATGTGVVFRAGNRIEITGTTGTPFVAEGQFTAVAGGDVCDPTTYSTNNPTVSVDEKNKEEVKANKKTERKKISEK